MTTNAEVERLRSRPVDLATCSRPELRTFIGLIGNTPLFPITILAPNPQRIFLKLEGANPGGSIKDRIANYMIDQLAERGLLTQGAALVDSTSGNFGVAMAWIARARGYRFIAVGDPKITPENAARIAAVGGTLEIVTDTDSTGGYLLTRIARAHNIAETEGAIWLNQYSSPNNPRAHYLSTGPELLGQMPEQRGVIFVPASTGGTLSGLGAFFRRHCASTAVIGVDGEASALFGGCAGRRVVNGLGSSRPSDFLTPRLYDDVIKVSAQDAFDYCRELYRCVGIEVGGSSGAAIAACALYLRTHASADTPVCICPDHGANYRSTIFSDEWMRHNGFATGRRSLLSG
jgi:2,3-diaminopropionate biosynthesis protein SbnA